MTNKIIGPCTHIRQHVSGVRFRWQELMCCACYKFPSATNLYSYYFDGFSHPMVKTEVHRKFTNIDDSGNIITKKKHRVIWWPKDEVITPDDDVINLFNVLHRRTDRLSAECRAQRAVNETRPAEPHTVSAAGTATGRARSWRDRLRDLTDTAGMVRSVEPDVLNNPEVRELVSDDPARDWVPVADPNAPLRSNYPRISYQTMDIGNDINAVDGGIASSELDRLRRSFSEACRNATACSTVALETGVPQEPVAAAEPEEGEDP